MRTTIRIDDELYRDVKARAARSGRTVASVLEDAVRVGLAVPEQCDAGRYEVRPTGSGGLRPGVDISASGALRGKLDEDESLDGLR